MKWRRQPAVPEPALAGGPAPSRSGARRVAGALVSDRYALILGWVGIAVLFAILRPDTFPSSANVSSILSSQGVLVIVSLAVVIPLLVGEFDLSVGAVLGLAAITTAVLNVEHGVNVWVAALAGLAVGPIIGAINAFFIVVVGVDGLITTLGVGTFATGIGFAISDYVIVSGISHPLVAFISDEVFGLPLSFYYGIVVAGVLWFVLRYTPSGQHLLFVGRAREVARLSGLRVSRIRFGALVMSGTLSALAGIVLAGTIGGADPTAGASYLLPAYSAAFLGATTINPGRFNPWGTVIAVYFLVTGISGLQLMGLSDWVQQVFYGISLVFAVTLSKLAERRKSR